MIKNENVYFKKRLMFVNNEDFYFLVYNIVILLNELGCIENTTFVDHRKLAFLVDFVANPALINILINQIGRNKPLNPRDKQQLIQAYSNGAERINIVTRLVYALQTKKIFNIYADSNKQFVRISLNKETIPSVFIQNDIYKLERLNVKKMLTYVSRIRTLNFRTMLVKLFENNGVSIWHA